MVGEVEAADAVALHLLRVNDHLDINFKIRLRYLCGIGTGTTYVTEENFQYTEVWWKMAEFYCTLIEDKGVTQIGNTFIF